VLKKTTSSGKAKALHTSCPDSHLILAFREVSYVPKTTQCCSTWGLQADKLQDRCSTSPLKFVCT